MIDTANTRVKENTNSTYNYANSNSMRYGGKYSPMYSNNPIKPEDAYGYTNLGYKH
jgi:hypothetical protein